MESSGAGTYHPNADRVESCQTKAVQRKTLGEAMPVTTDREQQLLSHYKLTNLYPDTWPHQDDDDYSSDEDEDETNGTPARHPSKLSMNSRTSYSKYRNIDRHASTAGSVGPESVVQRDEGDPLGLLGPSVAAQLRKKGIPVEDDLKLRNRFMLSSTSFSPSMFLAQVHQDASTEDLLRGLDFLSRSIEQKSASLKVLVESNFEKFVKAKATIDNVYTEMRTQGTDAEPASAAPPSTTTTRGGGRLHSRQMSRSSQTASTHFRNTSGPFSPTFNKTLANDRKKNALTKESEYGTLGIKAPLQEVVIKAEEVWGPALGGREKEETLKTVLTTLEQHREVFKLSGFVTEAIQKQDHDTVLASWRSAQRYAADARTLAANSNTLSEPQAQQILLTAKMYNDVSSQIETFKRDLWRRLKTTHGKRPTAVAEETDKEVHMETVGVLLQLGVDENPIWEWLNSRYLYLKDRIARAFERARIEIEISRRRLAIENERVDARVLAGYLRSVNPSSSVAFASNGTKDLDMPSIIAFWEKVTASLTHLLGSSDGILGELLEYWETAQSFIDSKAQKSFPPAVFAAGQEHLELEPDDVANLRSGCVELVAQLRDNTLSFFADPPVEDLSELYSPIPPTPVTPDSASNVKRSFSFDPANVPPPSPRRGDAWEKFAFWPPQANSLSGSHYLARLLTLIGTASSEMAALSASRSTRSEVESLKTLVSTVRERSVAALCSAWTADAERFKWLETWERVKDGSGGGTVWTGVFREWEEKVLSGFQKVAYVSDVGGRSGEVVTPPPAKLLQAVRGCFVTSLYKVMSGMVEIAETTRREDGGEADGVTLPKMLMDDGVAGGKSNRNTRLLLTLSNLSHLRTDTLPHLISHFESAFSVKLTDESKTLRDVLAQIDARLFQAYVKPTVDAIAATITEGINKPDWVPQTARPTDARGYVYDVLLTLVLVHSEVSTTAGTLTNQILSYSLEQASLALLAAFKGRQPPHYSLPALMQATLDVEFLAQTLNNYTTDKAGEVQSQVYLALDERTDDEARKRLQGELPEMRGVLKRLREGTRGEFGCFKRERRGRQGAGGGSTRA